MLEAYALTNLLTLESEEIVDWSKTPIDTKVLVSVDREIGIKDISMNVKMIFFIAFMQGELLGLLMRTAFMFVNGSIVN